MRKLAAVLAFVGFTLGLVALPATALAQTTSPTTSHGGGPNSLVSGPFTGTGTFDFPSPTCPLSDTAHQVFDGTYVPTPVQSGRTGSFHLDGCVTLVGPISFPFSGTFTLAAPDGATMNGTASGSIGANTTAFSMTLTTTGGTNEFAHVGGVVNLTGTWQSSAMSGVPGPISGSLAGALTH